MKIELNGDIYVQEIITASGEGAPDKQIYGNINTAGLPGSYTVRWSNRGIQATGAFFPRVLVSLAAGSCKFTTPAHRKQQPAVRGMAVPRVWRSP